MKKKFLVIIGASGFGKEVLLTINDCNKKSKKYEVLGFIDDSEKLWGRVINGKKVLGGIIWLLQNYSKINCVVCIGDPFIRKNVIEKLNKNKFIFPIIIHPSVIKSKFSKIGKGVIIQAGCIINPDSKIEDHVLINMDCTVAHDSVLKEFSTLSPGVHINGNNIIERGTYFGTGAVTKDNVNIGEWCVIGAGTIVIDDVKSFSLLIGNPGKVKRNIKRKRPKL